MSRTFHTPKNVLRLVDVNLSNGSCSLSSGSPKNEVGNVLDFRYMDSLEFASDSLIRFVKCSSNATLQFNKSRQLYNYTEVTCLSSNGSYMYVGVDDLYGGKKHPKTCSLFSLAPVDYHGELYKKRPTYEAVVKAMQGGFDIVWSVECRNCVLAGKGCGYGLKASETRPIVFECGGEYHEFGWAEVRLLTEGCVVGGVIFLIIIVALVVCGVCNCKKRKQRRKMYLQNQQASAV